MTDKITTQDKKTVYNTHNFKLNILSHKVKVFLPDYVFTSRGKITTRGLWNG